MAMILPMLVFTSCSKDDKAEISTFTIINNFKYETNFDKYINGTMYEVVVFEYDENGNNIGQINIDDVPSGGKSNAIPVQESCAKVQISFMMLPKESPYYDLPANKRKYVVSLWVIRKGENIDITINENTMISNSSSVKSYANQNNNTFMDVFESIQNWE